MVKTNCPGRKTPVIARICATLLVALTTYFTASSNARAEDNYPGRPVRIIVPTPPGGPVDVVARLVAHYLSGALGESAFVDNRPGAGNTIGSREAARAAPDGYTLHYSSISGLVLAPMLHKEAGYDAIGSFAPIAAVATTAIILVVHPSFPAHSVAELVAYAKSHPGAVNFSSGGIGVLPHLVGEMFRSRAGIDIVHVPYKGGGPSIQDVVAGNIQMTFEGSGVLLPLIESGKLRALAVAGTQRNPALPDVPTMIESGYPGFITSGWTGLLAPAGAPAPIISRLNAAINAGLQSEELKAGLAKLRAETLGGTPQDFTELIRSDIARWEPIVRSLNVKVD
jgi:tripartite-type tricarboxylate transporter receptor subunit TctC